MRSWMTAMPGEVVSCIGCHEKQNAASPNRKTIAARRPPSQIEPWYGPVRGFSFSREVQPVLDRYCVSCHDGTERDDGKTIPNLRGDRYKLIAYKNGVPEAKVFDAVQREELARKFGGVFDPSYIALRSYVRVGGLESDLRMLEPCEFHADTSELFQILNKGHYGVELDSESRDRLAAWIDLNAPCHGTWREVVGLERTKKEHLCRRKFSGLYSGIDEDPESYPEMARKTVEPIKPKQLAVEKFEVPEVAGWPFDADQADRRQAELALVNRSVDLGGGVMLDMVPVPAGIFVMGDADGCRDEQPPTAAKIEKPFWISRFEVTNEQYARFDSEHDSRFQDKGSWMFNEWDLGWTLNDPKQPVVHVSWKAAMAFCRWLSEETGLNVTLPTEAQWEWACRAGTNGPMFYGDLDADFSGFGNMADHTMRELVYDARDQYSPDLVPRDARFNDGKLVSSDVGLYRPNTWGLYDMHGNVWEWTRSTYMPYPYRADDGRNDTGDLGRKAVRGGSWYDRPRRCRSAFRLSYRPWQKVYNVGFRIIAQADEKTLLTAKIQPSQ